MRSLPTMCRALLFAATLALPMTASAQLNEGFETVSTLGASGWAIQNNSSPGALISWFQGNGIFTAFNGTANSYIAANFNSTGSTGTISNWLMTPVQTLTNGSVFSFYTKGNHGGFADLLELRMSTNGSSTNVGATTGSVGDFSVLLQTVNASLVANGYPGDWTQVTATVSGLGSPTTGRFAFRYFIPDVTVNGDYIGIDAVTYSSTVPEPSSLLLMGAGIAGIAAIRRRRAH